MTTQVRKNVMDMFIDGARRGFTIATTSLLPNVVMAFVIIQALKVTGLLEIVGRVCEPVMALWGLPGESATVLLAAPLADWLAPCTPTPILAPASGPLSSR